MHPILIKHFHEAYEAVNCHILYIGYTDADKVKEVLEQLSGKSVLTVNEATNFPRWGGMVRFFMENNKIRIEINADAAKSAQLTISSKLLNVSEIY